MIVQSSSFVLAAAALLGAAGCVTPRGDPGAEGAGRAGERGRATGMTITRTVRPPDAFAKQLEPVIAAKEAGEVDWKQVVDSMRRFTRVYPNYGPGWFNLGVARERIGELDGAEDAYRRAIHADADLREAHENLAALVYRRGNFRQAIEILQALIQRDPGAAAARVSLAQSLLAGGAVDRAMALAREALSRDPKNVEAYCLLASVAAETKDGLRARLLISQARKLDDGPRSACLHLVLGSLLLADGETAEALMELERAVAKDPNYIEPRFLIAEISMGYKDFARAAGHYKAIAEHDPSNLAAFVNLGVAFKGSGAFPKAEAAYLAAIELGADRPPAAAHHNLGVLYLRNLERLADARKHLRAYLELAEVRPTDPVYTWLQEIDQREQMEEEMKKLEEPGEGEGGAEPEGGEPGEP